ncbi:hypothetical protein BKA70DRAFT_1219952 [Coprinopsis sp. MPI-PUGE-AT-0042]|nr:hypothetical protein BKA70DRAFT_1219952 [Coprinopsis sp. MPI-PUGE-AT-0042]
MLAASTFGISILNASLLVVQIVLALYGISGFFATPKDRRKGRLRFIIISSLMVVLNAVDIGFDLWKSFLLLYTGGPEGESYLQAKNILDSSESWRWDLIGDAFLCTAIALGDILMLWRCIVLWTDRKWVVMFPSLACVGSIVSYIAYLAGIASFNADLSYETLLYGAILNVTMNIMVTFLIVLRVMRARSRNVKVFPDEKPPRWYSEVMALVIESAAPLAIFGICFIALRGTIESQSGELQSGHVLQRGRQNILMDAVQSFYDAFCILSPQMIIIYYMQFRVRRDYEVVIARTPSSPRIDGGMPRTSFKQQPPIWASSCVMTGKRSVKGTDPMRPLASRSVLHTSNIKAQLYRPDTPGGWLEKEPPALWSPQRENGKTKVPLVKTFFCLLPTSSTGFGKPIRRKNRPDEKHEKIESGESKTSAGD